MLTDRQHRAAHAKALHDALGNEFENYIKFAEGIGFNWRSPSNTCFYSFGDFIGCSGADSQDYYRYRYSHHCQVMRARNMAGLYKELTANE